MKSSIPFDQLRDFLMELDLQPVEEETLTTEEAAELLTYGHVAEC